MRFVLDDDELSKVLELQATSTGDFYDAEVVMVIFQTDRKILKKVIPKPLKPAPVPYGSVFFAKYPKTNFGSVYNEAALSLGVEFDGVQGSYCLTMPVTEDMALILGREIFGFPKKIADEISLIKTDTEVKGRYVRRNVELMTLSMPFEKEVDTKEFMKTISTLTFQELEGEEWNVVSYNFKYFTSPKMTGFDYKPRLVKQVTTIRPVSKIKLSNKFDLELKSSDRDDLGVIPIKSPLLGLYGIFNNSMHPGEVVAEVDEAQFIKHAFSKIDQMPTETRVHPDLKSRS